MKKDETKTARAKELRRNATDAEKRFWHAINKDKLGVKFRRQQPIGPYFVDFVCFDKKLVIELDGHQHADNIIYDNKRTDYLESMGYKIIRLPNRYVYNQLDAVIYSLRLVLNEPGKFEDFFQSRYQL